MKKGSLLLILLVLISSCQKQKTPLKIGYSDWPGWVAWDIAITKGWFEEEGVDVDFIWFEYVPSMDAFAAGQIDAVNVTNGDALVTGATGASNVMIMVSDYSNGNDMIVAQPEINNVADLKGKKIGLEVGFVEHLLLSRALESVGLSESDIELVNVVTHQTAQTLASGEVAAIAAWQPNSGQALKAVTGSKAIYTSANDPGLIYDCLTVSPASLSERKEDWAKVVKVWYRVVDFLNDPKHREEALEIMSARAGVSAVQYAELMKGTRFLSLEEAKEVFQKGQSLKSLYGSSKIVDEFNLKFKVYESPQDIEAYIDPSITLGL